MNVTDPAVTEAVEEYAALAAANAKLGSPFRLASAGWTLSPLELDSWAEHGGISPADGGNSSTIPLNGDRSKWNTALGAEYEVVCGPGLFPPVCVPLPALRKHLSSASLAEQMSAIAGHVGAFPIDPGFAKVGRSPQRQGWTIPWMEDDPVSPFVTASSLDRWIATRLAVTASSYRWIAPRLAVTASSYRWMATRLAGARPCCS